MDSARRANTNTVADGSDRYYSPHVQAVADRQGSLEGVDVEGGIVTPFNIYEPKNPIKTRIVVDTRRNIIDKKTAEELKAIQDRRAGVMSFNVRESHQEKQKRLQKERDE